MSATYGIITITTKKLLSLSTLMACRSKNLWSTFMACSQKSNIFKKLMNDKDTYNTTNMVEIE